MEQPCCAGVLAALSLLSQAFAATIEVGSRRSRRRDGRRSLGPRRRVAGTWRTSRLTDDVLLVTSDAVEQNQRLEDALLLSPKTQALPTMLTTSPHPSTKAPKKDSDEAKKKEAAAPTPEADVQAHGNQEFQELWDVPPEAVNETSKESGHVEASQAELDMKEEPDAEDRSRPDSEEVGDQFEGEDLDEEDMARIFQKAHEILEEPASSCQTASSSTDSMPGPRAPKKKTRHQRKAEAKNQVEKKTVGQDKRQRKGKKLLVFLAEVDLAETPVEQEEIPCLVDLEVSPATMEPTEENYDENYLEHMVDMLEMDEQETETSTDPAQAAMDMPDEEPVPGAKTQEEEAAEMAAEAERELAALQAELVQEQEPDAERPQTNEVTPATLEPTEAAVPRGVLKFHQPGTEFGALLRSWKQWEHPEHHLNPAAPTTRGLRGEVIVRPDKQNGGRA